MYHGHPNGEFSKMLILPEPAPAANFPTIPCALLNKQYPQPSQKIWWEGMYHAHLHGEFHDHSPAHSTSIPLTYSFTPQPSRSPSQDDLEDRPGRRRPGRCCLLLLPPRRCRSRALHLLLPHRR